MNQAALLNRFRSDALATASPAKLLTMLYDRLVLDLDRTIAAFATGDRSTATKQLGHAQQIIEELRASLDVAAWDGGQGLSDLYGYVLAELLTAGLTDDVAKVTAARDLLVPLRDTWHEAAASTTATGASVQGARAASAIAAGAASAPVTSGLGDLGVG